MRNRVQRVRPRFAPVVRFGVRPVPARTAQTAELEQLKNRLLRRLVRDAADADQAARVRRAAEESAAMVWLTPCPLLLFPLLLEEKARTALAQGARQSRIRRRSLPLLSRAA